MSNKTFTLPNNKELARRLRAADHSYHAVEYLHPLIIKYLKRGDDGSIRATIIILEIREAIEEYVTTDWPKSTPPAPTVIKLMWLRNYITHVVTDRAVRGEALRQISTGYPD